MATLHEQLAEVGAQIEALEEEQRQIYADSQVDDREHPRLGAITHELAHLWDMRRRIEAALSAGLSQLPVPPPEHPEDMVG